MPMMSTHVKYVLPLCMAFSSFGIAHSQDFPTKPIRILTGGVGGNSDFSARIIAQGMSANLPQQVIVENHGGGGVISGEMVAKAAPDGYTLLLSGSTFTVGDLLTKTRYPYDPVKDFAPVSLTNSAANVLVVHRSLPAKSVKELIALAKARPGEINCSAGVRGASSQLAAELFKHMTGVEIVVVPYTSGSVRMADLVGGHVQMEFATAGAVAPHLKSGKLRVLAVTSEEPSELMPGVPPIAATVPGFESVGMTGIFAPARTPERILNVLNREIVRVLKQPEVRKRYAAAGIETVGSSPQQYAAKIAAQRKNVLALVKSGAIEVN
jgi:tripartite-type tricarboxylate transporter receptor subunit TctC